MELHRGSGTGLHAAGRARTRPASSRWTIDSNHDFLYRPDYHDFGARRSWGRLPGARPQAGETAGMDGTMTFAEFLINHPATARHIATKLLRWFRPDPTNDADRAPSRPRTPRPEATSRRCCAWCSRATTSPTPWPS
ncbi:MAG: DUF1800 family protein [Gemmatimonadetes bacterium]|nr:DUF1800 family protein [Gemmatimonadota bacterium]